MRKIAFSFFAACISMTMGSIITPTANAAQPTSMVMQPVAPDNTQPHSTRPGNTQTVQYHNDRRHNDRRWRQERRYDHRYGPRYDHRPPRMYRPHYRQGINNPHVRWCYNRYRSYRAYDNSFQPNYGPRRQCYSPYL